jgi:hypothetical protein
VNVKIGSNFIIQFEVAKVFKGKKGRFSAGVYFLGYMAA